MGGEFCVLPEWEERINRILIFLEKISLEDVTFREIPYYKGRKG